MIYYLFVYLSDIQFPLSVSVGFHISIQEVTNLRLIIIAIFYSFSFLLTNRYGTNVVDSLLFSASIKTGRSVLY